MLNVLYYFLNSIKYKIDYKQKYKIWLLCIFIAYIYKDKINMSNKIKAAIRVRPFLPN